MAEPMTDDQFNAICERLAATDGPWFAGDCEGELKIWREAALKAVRRDESGEITDWQEPGHYPAVDLIAEWDLDTWDPGQDEDDDVRRGRAEFIAHAPMDVLALLSEVERLRAENGQLHARIDEDRQAAMEYPR